MKLDKCPICSGTFLMTHKNMLQIDKSAPENKDGMPQGLLITYQTCGICGIIFQNPRMGDDRIHDYYASGEYRDGLVQDDDDQRQIDLKERQDAERYLEFIDIPVRAALDVGCSRGIFLNHLKNKIDCKTYGVELNQQYVLHKPDTLYRDISQIEGAGFDLVTGWHVLEHVPDPRTMLFQMIDLLEPAGKLMIEFPSSSSQGGPYRLAHLYVLPPYTVINWLREKLSQVSDIKLFSTPHYLITATKT